MDLASNLNAVRDRIAAACARSNRPPDAVQLLAVTKGRPPEVVDQAFALGLRLFGENRVQEAKAKLPLCANGIEWHMIGHLQSNKCRDATALFDVIESVDSIHLARELHKTAAQAARHLRVLLEVNVAGEATKFGLAPDQLPALIEQFNQFPRLQIQGLMAIAPWTPEPEKVRPCFARLRELRQRCAEILGAPLPELSMGMSGDFEVAIEEGATIVRLGTALFGPR